MGEVFRPGRNAWIVPALPSPFWLLVAKTILVAFRKSSDFSCFKIFGPTTAACPLDDKKSLVDKSGILGRPGRAKKETPSLALKINK